MYDGDHDGARGDCGSIVSHADEIESVFLSDESRSESTGGVQCIGALNLFSPLDESPSSLRRWHFLPAIITMMIRSMRQGPTYPWRYRRYLLSCRFATTG